MNQLALLRPTALPALVAAAGDRASVRFLEFFAARRKQCQGMVLFRQRKEAAKYPPLGFNGF